MNAILCSIVALAAIGWVLRINARDRALLEQELEEEFVSDRGSQENVG